VYLTTPPWNVAAPQTETIKVAWKERKNEDVKGKGVIHKIVHSFLLASGLG
jgi:hypothetical protein